MANVWASSKILEADYAGIEAVILGWCMRDPTYIRIAKLGMHAYLASHVLGRPADLAWPDADLAAYFSEIKNSEDGHTHLMYDGSKRVVHGNGYGRHQCAFEEYLHQQHAHRRNCNRRCHDPVWHRDVNLSARGT